MTEYKKQIEEMLKDPRSNPENDWHEQWLIDIIANKVFYLYDKNNKLSDTR